MEHGGVSPFQVLKWGIFAGFTLCAAYLLGFWPIFLLLMFWAFAR